MLVTLSQGRSRSIKKWFRGMESVGFTLKEVRCDSNIGLDQNSLELLVVYSSAAPGTPGKPIEHKKCMASRADDSRLSSCRFLEAENGGCPVKDDELVAVTVKLQADRTEVIENRKHA